MIIKISLHFLQKLSCLIFKINGSFVLMKFVLRKTTIDRLLFLNKLSGRARRPKKGTPWQTAKIPKKWFSINERWRCATYEDATYALLFMKIWLWKNCCLIRYYSRKKQSMCYWFGSLIKFNVHLLLAWFLTVTMCLQIAKSRSTDKHLIRWNDTNVLTNRFIKTNPAYYSSRTHNDKSSESRIFKNKPNHSFLFRQ